MGRTSAWLAGALALLMAPGAAAQSATYGDDGLLLRTPGDRFTATVGFRNQIRFTTQFGTPPDAAGEIEDDRLADFRLNRSRFKLEGRAFSPRLTYRFQADFVEERIRDLNVTWAARDWLQVRAGWWKVEGLLERVQSSGAQQLVDRSVLDRWFTLGRQAGVQVKGRVGGEGPLAGTYYVGAFRNVDVDVGSGVRLPVWLARYTWSWRGREIEAEQGDPAASRELHLAFGSSAVRTESAWAFYAGNGLGQVMPVPGLPDEDVFDDLLLERPDRFRTRQYSGDLTMKYRGVSLQGEVHRKSIRVTQTGVERTLLGAYVMGGVLASTLWERAPRALELSARVAVVDPSRQTSDDSLQERVVGGNWYFSGHRNKVSVDVSQLQFATATGTRTTDVRTRVQWEFTF